MTPVWMYAQRIASPLQLIVKKKNLNPINTSATNTEQALLISTVLPTGKIMVKDEMYVYTADCVQSDALPQHGICKHFL